MRGAKQFHVFTCPSGLTRLILVSRLRMFDSVTIPLLLARNNHDSISNESVVHVDCDDNNTLVFLFKEHPCVVGGVNSNPLEFSILRRDAILSFDSLKIQLSSGGNDD